MQVETVCDAQSDAGYGIPEGWDGCEGLWRMFFDYSGCVDTLCAAQYRVYTMHVCVLYNTCSNTMAKNNNSTLVKLRNRCIS